MLNKTIMKFFKIIFQVLQWKYFLLNVFFFPNFTFKFIFFLWSLNYSRPSEFVNLKAIVSSISKWKKKTLPSFLHFQVTLDNINQISCTLSWKQFGNNYLRPKMLGLWYCGSDNNKRKETNSNIVSVIVTAVDWKYRTLHKFYPILEITFLAVVYKISV